jgi:tetratricopeptide (TPR) repeat protein
MPVDAPGELRLRTLISLGDEHTEIGLNRRSLWQARLGIRIMRQALESSAIEVSAAERANAFIRLGTALANAGLVSNDPRDFEDSVAAYKAAQELIEGLDEPLVWARAWWGLAIAYAGEGKAKRSTAILLDAERCCDEALKVLTRGEHPIDWATNIQNRGNAKLERGSIENDTETLRSAIDDYERALEIRTQERFPLGYAKTLGNMAIAKRLMAERQSDVDLAREALANIRSAIGALVGGADDYWTTYYGAEQERLAELVEALSRRSQAQ